MVGFCVCIQSVVCHTDGCPCPHEDLHRVTYKDSVLTKYKPGSFWPFTTVLTERLLTPKLASTMPFVLYYPRKASKIPKAKDKPSTPPNLIAAWTLIPLHLWLSSSPDSHFSHLFPWLFYVLSKTFFSLLLLPPELKRIVWSAPATSPSLIHTSTQHSLAFQLFSVRSHWPNCQICEH